MKILKGNFPDGFEWINILVILLIILFSVLISCGNHKNISYFNYELDSTSDSIIIIERDNYNNSKMVMIKKTDLTEIVLSNKTITLGRKNQNRLFIRFSDANKASEFYLSIQKIINNN